MGQGQWPQPLVSLTPRTAPENLWETRCVRGESPKSGQWRNPNDDRQCCGRRLLTLVTVTCSERVSRKYECKVR